MNQSIKRLAHLIMFINVLIATILVLPGCDNFFDKPVPTVSWTSLKVNGTETIIYQCQLVRSSSQSVITTLQYCDSKAECNNYCERARTERIFK